MANPWMKKVLAFNRRRAEVDGKAADVDVLVGAMMALPSGQLKKLLTEDVLAVLKKYGYTGEE